MDNLHYLSREYRRWQVGEAIDAPLKLYQALVHKDWIDYNGHLSESYYLLAFGDASDALFRYIGIDEAYRTSGFSFYTVESHINYYQEVSEAEPLFFSTQILGLDGKRLHLFHRMVHGETGNLLATTEQMLLHVDMHSSRATPIAPAVYEALQEVMSVHSLLPRPEQVGRVMAIPVPR